MSVNDTHIKTLQKEHRHPVGKAIYFGNALGPRLDRYREIYNAFTRNGWQLDTIRLNQFNGNGIKLSQREAWQIISRYQYGVGIGRCALEMSALGLKILLAGVRDEGIVTNHVKLAQQREWNYTGYNLNGNLESSIRNFDDALIIDGSFTNVAPLIKQEINSIRLWK